jgi:hypothetical protein
VEEDLKLLNEVKSLRQPLDSATWHRIGISVGRTPKQCRERYVQVAAGFNNLITPSPSKCLSVTPIQTYKQFIIFCRWCGSLDPSLNKSPWTDEEVALVEQFVTEMGHAWGTIARLLGRGRSDLAIRNLYYSRQRLRARHASGIAIAARATGLAIAARLSNVATSSVAVDDSSGIQKRTRVGVEAAPYYPGPSGEAWSAPHMRAVGTAGAMQNHFRTPPSMDHVGMAPAEYPVQQPGSLSSPGLGQNQYGKTLPPHSTTLLGGTESSRPGHHEQLSTAAAAADYYDDDDGIDGEDPDSAMRHAPYDMYSSRSWGHSSAVGDGNIGGGNIAAVANLLCSLSGGGSSSGFDSRNSMVGSRDDHGSHAAHAGFGSGSGDGGDLKPRGSGGHHVPGGSSGSLRGPGSSGSLRGPGSSDTFSASINSGRNTFHLSSGAGSLSAPRAADRSAPPSAQVLPSAAAFPQHHHHMQMQSAAHVPQTGIYPQHHALGPRAGEMRDSGSFGPDSDTSHIYPTPGADVGYTTSSSPWRDRDERLCSAAPFSLSKRSIGAPSDMHAD